MGTFLQSRLPLAERHVVDGGTHAMAFDMPDRVAPLVDAFLGGVG